MNAVLRAASLIEYIPLQQGLRLLARADIGIAMGSLSIFHYNKD